MSGDRFSDGFEPAVDRLNQSSDRALYPYLRVGILGPYAGDCHAYLNEFRLSLCDHGFEQVHLATDRNSDVPEEVSDSQFWYEDSVQFLEECDAVIFLFCSNDIRRPYLSDRAFEKSKTDRTSAPQDMNGSIVVELGEWVDMVPDPEESTLVLYEEPCYQEVSSLVEGKVEYTGIDDRVIEPHIIDEAIQEGRSKCKNWAMGRFKQRLQDRYLEDR
jgi:hypothetical protein